MVSTLLAQLRESATAFRDWLLAEIETDRMKTLKELPLSGVHDWDLIFAIEEDMRAALGADVRQAGSGDGDDRSQTASDPRWRAPK